MLDFDTAQLTLAQAGQPPTATELCPIHQAGGRVLAQTLFATLDLPPADNSAMDGYAIRFADYAPGRALPVQQRCYAGQMPEALQPGQAIRLFTGSLMPAGADTVVMQENGQEANNQFTITVPPAQGDHVRLRGEDVRADDQLLPMGTRLGPGQIALLASQGYAEVPVFRPLRVSILTTGDELVPAGQPRAEHQIHDSNGPMLAALVGALDARVIAVHHACDTTESLEQAFTTLLPDCDLLLTVGGVSVGDKDLVKPVLESLGGQLDLWKVAMKPGKPVALAHIQGKPVVCLPGNPVSAFVVYSLLVTPLIRTLQGRIDPFPSVLHGILDTPASFNEKREEFLRVQIHDQGAGSLPGLVPYALQGSNIIRSLDWAGALARIPAGTRVAGGDVVRYYDLKAWLG